MIRHESKIREITETVCNHFEVRIEEVLSPSRQMPVATARQFSMYHAYRELRPFIGVKDIGKFFGRDHCTVSASLRRVQHLLDGETKFVQAVNGFVLPPKVRAFKQKTKRLRAKVAYSKVRLQEDERRLARATEDHKRYMEINFGK